MSGIKFMGKDPLGLAKPVNVDTSGNLQAKITGSEVAVPVDIQFHNLVDNPLPVRQSTGATAYESIVVGVGSVGLTIATFGSASKAFITAEVAQMRFRIDGVAPTATEGHILNPGDIVELDSADDIASFKVIRTGGISGVIKVTYSEVV